MARAHAEADTRGVSTSAEGAARISRRGFIGGVGLAATALALPACAVESGDAADLGADLTSKGGGARIAIVGAGISGLVAALSLADAKLGSNLTIYESSNRIGGRMFSNTDSWDNNQVSEWCGECIDTGHTTIRALAKRYRLTVDVLTSDAPAGSESVSFFEGTYYTHEEMNHDFAPVFAVITKNASDAIADKTDKGAKNTDGTVLWNAITPAGKKLDAMSVYDWIEANVSGGHGSKMGKLLDAAYASEYGADTKDQSALNLVLLLSGLTTPAQFETFGASDERYHIRGGNQQLPVAIADELEKRLGQDAIRMNSKLTKIVRQTDGTIRLTFEVKKAGKVQSEDVIADVVILTLPFACLADVVDYSQAGFDVRKKRAIKELGRGYCAKLQLQFRTRLWHTAGAWGDHGNNGEETFSDNGNQCSWEVTRAQPGVTGIINAYSGGAVTNERAKVAPVAFGKVDVGSAGAGIATLVKAFLGQLEQIFPGITPLYNGKATLSVPHLDPNMRLSYAYWKVGQYQAFAGYERARQGNIFFGGEHTSVNFQGFMEGGAAEGERAAMEVVTALKANRKAAA